MNVELLREHGTHHPHDQSTNSPVHPTCRDITLAPYQAMWLTEG